jgi:replication factor C large subunit
MRKDFIPWSRKHQPRKFKDVVGQDEAIEALIKFVRDYDVRAKKKKGALLYGPTGSGKTSSVYAVASELGLEVVETNASDFRNAAGIETIAGAASVQMSLFGKGKIILIDEIDGLSGRSDRGAPGAVQDVIKKSAFPVVMTANDPWNKKFSKLRRQSFMVEYKQLGTNHVIKALGKICETEGIKVELEALNTISIRSAGDMRGAITDLQLLCSGVDELKKEAVDELSERNRIELMNSALLKVFKTTDPGIAVNAFENVEERPEDCFAWLDENIPGEYKKPVELARAYDALSRADVYKGRIMKRQYWRLLSYFIQIMSVGTAVAKDEKYDVMSNYKRSDRGLKIYMAKARNHRKLDIAARIAGKLHTSKSSILTGTLPFLKVIFSKEKNQEKIDTMANELDLGKEEVDWLTSHDF